MSLIHFKNKLICWWGLGWAILFRRAHRERFVNIVLGKIAAARVEGDQRAQQTDEPHKFGHVDPNLHVLRTGGELPTLWQTIDPKSVCLMHSDRW